MNKVILFRKGKSVYPFSSARKLTWNVSNKYDVLFLKKQKSLNFNNYNLTYKRQ